MTAHWVVLAAVTLTTQVAAVAGAALAVFADQALPQAVRHDLLAAPGTTLAAAGSFASGNLAQTTAALRSSIAAGLGGVSFSFWQGTLRSCAARPASRTASRHLASVITAPLECPRTSSCGGSQASSSRKPCITNRKVPVIGLGSRVVL
jgi:hypothetical protein